MVPRAHVSAVDSAELRQGRMYAGEMMDAVSGSNTNAGKHVLSALTLALLQDTGWYAPCCPPSWCPLAAAQTSPTFCTHA